MANVFLFQKKIKHVKKMNSWPAMIGLFKSARVFYVFHATNQFLFLLFIRYYIYKVRIWIRWQAWGWAKHMTWVRAPGLQLSQYYFSIKVHMRFKTEDVPYTSKSSMPRVQLHPSQGSELRNMVDPSQCFNILPGKSPKRPSLMGQITELEPPCWGLPPP